MTTKDTSGFYKTDNNNKLIFAPNSVRAPDYDLLRKDKDSYTYPIHGWHWFDTRDDAKNFFGITEEETPRVPEQTKEPK
jgi:hypothetical protein